MSHLALTDSEPAEPDAMDTAIGKHRWEISNLSVKIDKKLLRSEQFNVGGIAWQMLLFPLGKTYPHDYISLYLDVAENAILPDGWELTTTIGFRMHGAATSDNEDEATINAPSVQSTSSKSKNIYSANSPD